MTESWKAFCTEEKRETVWQRSYRVMKLTEGPRSEKLLRATPDGPILDPRGSANLITQAFYPRDSEATDSPSQSLKREEARAIVERLREDQPAVEEQISKVEIEAAYRSSNAKKAPGEDGLTSDICHAAYKSAPDVQLGLLNQCLKMGYFPVIWKRAIVRIIPKPGKDDYTNPKSYRPIGLLPVLGKIFEKVIAARLSWRLMNNGKLDSRQYGFTAHRGTEDALYDALTMIRRGLQRKQITAVVSLDIEGAFDNCWWPAIITQLHDKNIDRSLLRVVTSYLSQREVSVDYLEETSTTSTNKGCVQGSVCGPLFWNVQLDPLLQAASGLKAHVQAFADDILVIASGSTEEEVENAANEALDVVAKWGADSKMKFAAHKTQAILVTRRLKYRNPKLMLNGHELQYSDSLKVLGLTVDRHLTFRPHLEEVYRRTTNVYKAMARAVKTQWGLNPEITRLIYLVTVEPVVLYAASAWAPATDYLYIRKRLDQITRMFALKISRAHRTTSLISSALLARILPLSVRLKEQAALYEVKRGKPLPELPGRRLQARVSPYELPHPASRGGISFGKLENQDNCDEVTGDGLPVLYTDGSKIEGRVGAAVTVWRDGAESRSFKIKLADYCSVYQAEMAAILRALVYLEKTGTSGKIISDSRSALEALSEPSNENPIAVEVQQHIAELKAQNIQVEFFWVRAHVGIAGNERADDLAKDAALKMKTPPAYDAYPITYARRIIRERSLEEWQSLYSAAETGHLTKTFFPDVKRAYKVLKTLEITPVRTQIFSGHCGVKAYLHRFRLSDDPFCTCGDSSEETVLHVLLDCPKYALRRFECECRMDRKLDQDNLSSIIEDNNCRPILLAFAELTLRKAARANGAIYV